MPGRQNLLRRTLEGKSKLLYTRNAESFTTNLDGETKLWYASLLRRTLDVKTRLLCARKAESFTTNFRWKNEVAVYQERRVFYVTSMTNQIYQEKTVDDDNYTQRK